MHLVDGEYNMGKLESKAKVFVIPFMCIIMRPFNVVAQQYVYIA